MDFLIWNVEFIIEVDLKHRVIWLFDESIKRLTVFVRIIGTLLVQSLRAWMFWRVIWRGNTFPENLNIVGGVPVILCEFPNFDMILTGVILRRRLSTT